MFKIINLTNKTIPINKNLELLPRSVLTVQSNVSSNLYYLMKLGLITIKEVKE